MFVFIFRPFFGLKALLNCDSSGICLPISRSLHLLCTFSFFVLLKALLLVFYVLTPASLNTFPLLHLFLSIIGALEIAVIAEKKSSASYPR